MTTRQPPDASEASQQVPVPVVIVGVGNDTRGDDGVGPCVVSLLDGRVPPGTRLVTVPADPLALIDAWDGATRVIVVDAMRTGAAPGGIERLDSSAPGDLDALLQGATTSSHGFGVAETIALARSINRLPARVVVFGIEAASLDFGASLSAAVATAALEVADRIEAELGER